MKASVLVTIAICTFVRLGSARAKEICPKVCICDIFESHKRADCSEQNLISPEINLAKSVEILNLSGNQIATIENEDFEPYVDLINLSLAKNAIHTIELFAFVSLAKLSYLDLSDNRLEYIDNRIIEVNTKLTVLDLSGNKFMMIAVDSPLIISKSLEFLSLRSSQLSFIYDSFFSEMPSVLDLDLSSNLLITLKSAAFFHLDSLQFINLEYNQFTCDTSTHQAIRFLKQRKVFIKIDKCMNVKKPKMFEKMILLSSPEHDESKEDVEIDLVWGGGGSGREGGKVINGNASDMQHMSGLLKDYYVELKNNLADESYCKNDEFASMLCECRQNFLMHYEMTNRSSVILRKNVELRINTVFYVGLILGGIGGCIISYCLLTIKKKCQEISRKQVERQTIRDRIVREYNQEVREIPPTISRPSPRPSPVPRTRSHVPPSLNPQSPLLQRQMRNEFSPTANLLHKLFRNRENMIQQHQPPTTSTSAITAPSAPPRPSRDVVESPRPPRVELTAIEVTPDVSEIALDRSEDESDYMSINESIILEPDRSATPPPAYREIYK